MVSAVENDVFRLTGQFSHEMKTIGDHKQALKTDKADRIILTDQNEIHIYNAI